MNDPAKYWAIVIGVIAFAVLVAWLYIPHGMVSLAAKSRLLGGSEIVVQAVPDDGSPVSADQLGGLKEVLYNRLDPEGNVGVRCEQIGTDQLKIFVAGEKQPERLVDLITNVGRLEFVSTGTDAFEPGTEFNEPGSSKRKAEFAAYSTILTGADLKRAFVQYSQGQPIVGFEFKPDAGETFGQFTSDHVEQYVCILLDGKVLTCPVIQSAIWGGKGVINGKFQLSEVQRIVAQLNSGALPVPVVIISSKVVEPS